MNERPMPRIGDLRELARFQGRLGLGPSDRTSQMGLHWKARAAYRARLVQLAFNRARIAQLTFLRELLETGVSDDAILDSLNGRAPWRAAA